MEWEPKNPHPKTQKPPSVQPALHRAFDAGVQAGAKKLVEWLWTQGSYDLDRGFILDSENWFELRRQVGLE